MLPEKSSSSLEAKRMPAAPGEFLRDSSDPQLQLLRDRAWQVHLLRGAKDYMVSRSTLLYTAATISPLVLAALEINGLNVRVWERSLGLNQRPAFGMPQPAPYDFLVEPGTDATVTRHGQQWKREHDVLGICAAIFQTIDGKASRHVTFAGLNVQAAANQLAVLVDAARDGLVDFAKLELQFSPRMAGIFEEAVALNREFRVRYRALTASQVAIAAAMFADHPAAMATSFLRHYILANTGADRFGTLITEWMTWYDKANSTNYDRWTQTLTAIVLRARHLSQQTRNRPEIAARHLIGALIASDRWAANSGVPALFAAADIDQRKLARTYLQYLTESPVDDTQPQRDDLEVWRTFLGFSTRSVVPRFNAEDLDGNDLLNVSANVEAFASLIASNHINPPLSIGLFGDWGSGKSFFMSKMREAIAKRALRATGRENSVFHQRIVQIDFNAWHYVEANLWASMVEHLFRNLKLTYEKPSEEAVSARREELLKQLDTMMAAKVAAEENVNKAVIARDQAALELEAQKKTADANAAAARNLRAKDVWEMV
ncbi:MAG TPA: P-loop NTPase fold protein, partial [Thermoanaerobaculia bacterium]|nr:P-loop NTPase fold protein [Thermoanaerobaculia bacterium]